MATNVSRKVYPLTKDQLDELMVWRSEALERMPYFARILFSFRPLSAPGLKTFACDPGYRLYIDFDAVTQRGIRWCTEALLHECGHMYNDHAARAIEYGVADVERFNWNMAGDAEINDDLAAAGCQTLADSGILPSYFQMDDHLLAEQYMDEIRRRQPPSSPSAGAPDQSGSSPFSGCGSASGGEVAPCELEQGDDASGAAPAATASEKKVIQIATAVAVREHAAKHPGSTPGGLVTRAETILAPSKLPWRQILASSVRRATAMRAGVYDTTFTRPNRRRSNVEVAPGRRGIYPGNYAPEPLIAVVRDTSGSMSDEDLSAVTIEIEGIARQMGVRGDALRILDVDAAVASVKGYHGVSTLDEVTGRGGTDMGAGVAYAVTLHPRPTVIVVVTDGYTPWPDAKPRMPVVICVVGRGDLSRVVEATPDWATTVAVDIDEE
ncbi:MAG: vWA domain-containing protein [Acidimicrobiales bacterium]